MDLIKNNKNLQDAEERTLGDSDLSSTIRLAKIMKVLLRVRMAKTQAILTAGTKEAFT